MERWRALKGGLLPMLKAEQETELQVGRFVPGKGQKMNFSRKGRLLAGALAGIGALVVCAPGAKADIVVSSGAAPTPSNPTIDPGAFTYTYQATITNNEVAKRGDYFTINNFFGYDGTYTGGDFFNLTTVVSDPSNSNNDDLTFVFSPPSTRPQTLANGTSFSVSINSSSPAYTSSTYTSQAHSNTTPSHLDPVRTSGPITVAADAGIAPVPEPAFFQLGGALAVGGLAFFRRRKGTPKFGIGGFATA